MFEIRTVIEDTRADMFGAINLAFNIWEVSILPMLLFNAESWTGISRKTLKILDDLFHTFCRTIFRVSVSCPIPSYYVESGSLMFSNHILKRKLVFIRHLANLPEQSLGRIVIDEQIKYALPGLFKDCEEHLNRIGVTNLQGVSKYSWRKMVQKYVFQKNKTEVLDMIRSYKKLSYNELSSETFARKHYLSNLSLENARMRFRIASKLVPTIRKNYSSKYRRMGQPLTCPSCTQLAPAQPRSSVTANPGETDSAPLHSQSHILNDCIAVSDL